MRVLLALGLTLAVLALALVEVRAQTCIDENGAPVDWFAIVKLPRLKTSSNSGVQTGIGYIYGDANSYSNPAAFWSASQHTVADASSSVGATVSQIYAQASNSSFGYVMYNDELPVTSMTYGHTKGHIAWSADSGFWLVHSVPKFADAPASTSSYAYPHTGEEFGQSMLCVTLNLTMIDTAFLQFQLTNPQVYAKQWVPELNDLMPNGNAFVNSGTVNMASASNQVTIETINGFAFTHFAKTVAWGQSIYGNLIGPYYSTGVVAETWQRPYETPLLPPTTQEAVYSVRTLSVPSYITDFGTATWKESEDHAKWALAEIGSSLPLFCVGDINKQVTQWKRSGGMMCILDVTLHQAFLALVTSTDQSSAAAAEVAQPAVKESSSIALA